MTTQESTPVKKSRNFLISALSAAISAVLAGNPSAANAQQQGANAGPLEEIAVTGSRIRASGMNTPTPVTTLDASELESMAPGNLIESISQLPQFFNNSQPQTQLNFAGSAGASNLNLRGIGTQRTLILLDGRRMVPTSRSNTVDIGIIPDSMIRRVDTVTGGASAAYGTDAVAGAVNFILDTDFTGVDFHVQGGSTGRGDAENVEGGINFGTDIGERGHLLFSAGGFRQEEVDGYKGRNWFKSYGTVTNPAWQAAVDAGECRINVRCAAGPQLITAPNVVSTQYTFGGLTVSPNPALNNLEFLPDGSVQPFQFSSLSIQGRGSLSQSIAPEFGGGSGDNVEADRGGQGGLVPQISRINEFAYFDYDVKDNIKLFVQSLYGRSQTDGVGNAPVLFGPWQGTIFADNAFLPETLRQAMLDNGVGSVGLSRMHSTADIALGRVKQINQTASFTGGFEANILSGFMSDWQVKGFYQWGRTEGRIRMIDFFRMDRLPLAMDAVVDPTSNNIVCRAAMFNPAEFGNCVPIDLLGAGRASDEAIDYVLARDDGTNLKVQAANLEQHVVDVSMSGDVYEGWGAGSISAAFGAAYRRDRIQQTIKDPTNPLNDPNVVAVPFNDPANGIQGIPGGFVGSTTGFQFSGAQNFQGRINVYEAFTEVLVPVLSNLPGVEQLNITGAGRWANYSGSGTVWSYKFGSDWQVTNDLRLRMTGSRDVRAGSLSERFDQQGQGTTVTDPFRDGQTHAAGQTIGGNPLIDPEKSKTITAGLIYQPSWLDGFSTSLDWYRIRVKGLIAQLGTQTIINQCFQGSESQCANITRDDPAGDPEFGIGVISNVFNAFQNLGRNVVSGVDLEATYRRDVNFIGGLGGGSESISFRGFYSYLDRDNTNTDPGNPNTLITNVGTSGTFTGTPRNKVTAGITYRNGPLGLFVQERFISKLHVNNRFNGVDTVEGVQIDDNRVSSAAYTDLKLSYNFDQATTGGSVEVFVNVTNLLDKNPPVRASFSGFFGSTQAIDGVHDILGRRLVMGVRGSF
ncbi:MAG: TonB-dependent receptor [Pseudomonadales bacterium]|nr:TonB-dependent receptor [Pseudomonadales bacterium]